MSKKLKVNLTNTLVAVVIILVLGVIFVPMITVSAEAIAAETSMFKFVDWFTNIKTKLVDDSSFYLLATAVVAFVLYLKHYLKRR